MKKRNYLIVIILFAIGILGSPRLASFAYAESLTALEAETQRSTYKGLDTFSGFPSMLGPIVTLPQAAVLASGSCGNGYTKRGFFVWGCLL